MSGSQSGSHFTRTLYPGVRRRNGIAADATSSAISLDAHNGWSFMTGMATASKVAAYVRATHLYVARIFAWLANLCKVFAWG